jgi:hypothetical protein
VTASCVLAAGLAGASVAAAADVAATRCAVSATGPLKERPGFNVGTTRLAVALPRSATFVAVPEGEPGWAFMQSDGTISAKVGWLSQSGRLRVSGRRLDRAAPPLDADVGVESYTSAGRRFHPSILTFPTAGCWKITARNAQTRLQFVVRVVKG